MNILFLIKTLTINGGGAERVIASITSSLSKRSNYNIFLATFDKKDDQFFYKIHDEVNIIKLDIGSVREKTKITEFLKRIHRLRKLSRAINADLVVGFNSSSYMLLWLSMIGMRIPVISSEHSSFKYFRDNIFQRLFLKLSSLFSPKFTVISESSLRSFPAITRKYMTVIRNPIELKGIERANMRLKDSGNIILSVGRLESEKNHLELIEAFSMVSEKLPNWSMRIVGEGKMREELQERIINHKMVGRIFLTGSKRDISKEYLKSKFMVIPSKYEGFGLVVAEALSHGLPVIAFSDCEGVLDLVSNENNGIVVDASINRIKSLSEAIFRLAKDGSLRQNLANKCVPTNGHNLDKITDTWIQLFNSIQKNKNY